MVTVHRIRVSALVPVVTSVVLALALTGPAAAIELPRPIPWASGRCAPSRMWCAASTHHRTPSAPAIEGSTCRGRVGQPVHSALAGTVTYAGLLAGRGVIVVNHGPTRTTYEPVAAMVRVGEAVAQGDRIGTLELAGSHCFPAACLHWGWLRGDVYLNPLDLVGHQRVRLLPLYSASPPTRTADFRSVLPAYAGWRPLLDLFRAADDPATRARSP